MRALGSMFAFVALATMAGCSSSDGGQSTTVGAIPASFSAYCTGTLKIDQELMFPAGGGAWMGNGTKAAAGTVFLVAAEFGQFGGFVMQSDGKPAKIEGDFTKGLVKDTDFTSDCATTADDRSKTKFVLLAKAKLYPNADLTGTACELEAASTFENYAYSSSGSSATFSSPALAEKCGFDKGYSNDIYFGRLLTR